MDGKPHDGDGKAESWRAWEPHGHRSAAEPRQPPPSPDFARVETRLSVTRLLLKPMASAHCSFPFRVCVAYCSPCRDPSATFSPGSLIPSLLLNPAIPFIFHGAHLATLSHSKPPFYPLWFCICTAPRRCRKSDLWKGTMVPGVQSPGPGNNPGHGRPGGSWLLRYR